MPLEKKVIKAHNTITAFYIDTLQSLSSNS